MAEPSAHETYCKALVEQTKYLPYCNRLLDRAALDEQRDAAFVRDCARWPCASAYKSQDITTEKAFRDKCTEIGGTAREMRGGVRCTKSLPNDQDLLTCKYWNGSVERCAQ